LALIALTGISTSTVNHFNVRGVYCSCFCVYPLKLSITPIHIAVHIRWLRYYKNISGRLCGWSVGGFRVWASWWSNMIQSNCARRRR